MILFTLLFVMALERVVPKTKALHIATIAQQYFSIVAPHATKQEGNADSTADASIFKMLLIAGIPTLGVWALVEYLPGILIFFLYILLIWICLGCPVTRQTYKRYLEAASREDFEACYLYSEKFGTQGKDLSNVGKQLVLVNYRQYASVIIFFVALGLPGMIFYSLCKEWYFFRKEQNQAQVQTEIIDASNDDSNLVHKQTELIEPSIGEDKVMFVLDWIPSRITAFGFLLVGHFSNALPVWLNTFLNPKESAYDVLAKVAKSSEELKTCENIHLQEPMQMVSLVKRNIMFLLMTISILTLTGVLS